MGSVCSRRTWKADAGPQHEPRSLSSSLTRCSHHRPTFQPSTSLLDTCVKVVAGAVDALGLQHLPPDLHQRVVDEYVLQGSLTLELFQRLCQPYTDHVHLSDYPGISSSWLLAISTCTSGLKLWLHQERQPHCASQTS